MQPEDLQNFSQEEIIELQRKNCIFCKIIQKEIPSNEIYSDEKVFVILDINPANEGHCLVMPKHHYQILPQLPDELIAHLSVVAKKTSRAVLKSLGVKGTTIFIANGALAGQKAPHFMLHVIPRKNNDMLFQMQKNASDEKILEEIKAKLSAKMAAMTGKKTMIAHKEEPKKEKQEAKADMDINKISELFG